MSVQATAKKKTPVSHNKPKQPQKTQAKGKTSSGAPAKRNSVQQNTANRNTPNHQRDVASLSKPEEPPRDGFVNPLKNLDSKESADAKPGAEEPKSAAPEAKPGAQEDKPRAQETQPVASGLPQGFTMERAQQTVQQIQNFSNLATHLPDILSMGDEIKKGGIQAKHTEALKAAFEPLKGVLTPENIQAFKGMNVDQVNKLFSPENMQALKAVAPELADKLSPDKIKKLTEGMKKAQGMLDKDKLGQGMSMLAPFVKTSKGDGALNMVAGMVDDPNQLGGADRKLSLTDIPQVTNGLLNTGPVRGIVNGKIADGINHAVHYRQDGRRRRPAGEALVGWATSRPRIRGKIYQEAWSQVRGRAPGEISKQAAPYLSANGAAADRSTPRRFDDGHIQSLMDAGRQVQSMRGQNYSSGNQQIDNANQAMAGVTGILHKSVVGEDGMVSGDELRNVSGFGTQLYNYMGLLYTGVGGTYQ